MRLVGMPFSPWTEKARWALDHHRLDYTFEEHIPGPIGELRLKVLMREPSRRVTVPVLKADRWYTDSFEIARYADRIGSGTKLLPEDRLQEIAVWNTRSETALAAGRAMMLLKTGGDPKMIRAAIPKGIPAVLHPLLMPVARKGMEAFIHKYKMREGAEGHERAMTEVLDALAQVVSPERPYLLREFSYADITMALTLQFVRPVDESFMPVGMGGREAWENRELAARYTGLLEWRDALYARHRRQTVRSA